MYLGNEITDGASDERAEHGDLGDAVDLAGRERVPRLGVGAGDPDGLGRRVPGHDEELVDVGVAPEGIDGDELRVGDPVRLPQVVLDVDRHGRLEGAEAAGIPGGKGREI